MMRKSYEIQMSVSTNKVLLEHSLAHLLPAARDPQSPGQAPPGPLQSLLPRRAPSTSELGSQMTSQRPFLPTSDSVPQAHKPELGLAGQMHTCPTQLPPRGRQEVTFLHLTQQGGDADALSRVVPSALRAPGHEPRQDHCWARQPEET